MLQSRASGKGERGRVGEQNGAWEPRSGQDRRGKVHRVFGQKTKIPETLNYRTVLCLILRFIENSWGQLLPLDFLVRHICQLVKVIVPSAIKLPVHQ